MPFSFSTASSGGYDLYLTDMSKRLPLFDYNVTMRRAVKV